MNKTAIKNYAIRARVQLIESAKQRAYEYEITEDCENNSNLDSVGGRLLSSVEKEQRKELISQIRAKGYTQVMEEAAYTWFNRFIALRFMEVNGYLPSKVRVFTDENNAFKPEIFREAMNVELDGIDKAKVLDLLDKQNNEELYKYLLIIQCNALNAGLPYMFEKIANWTELLFPSNLLRPDSVLAQMIAEIPEEDWTDAVQIIGWFYQFYNIEPKAEVFGRKSGTKMKKEDIPAATQLFTPDWIVRYMVENSLGRLWSEGHPAFDKSDWKYYLDEAEQEPEVESQLIKIREEYSRLKPEDIKVIDPCMGSGHILVYAFDVLMQIYTSAGWGERDAAKSILENNLYGLDIDDRAGQLAYFAVMMKARKYNRRILNGEVKTNVMSIQESNWMTDEFIDYVAGKDLNMKADLTMLRKTFTDAKEYGSILNVPAINYDALYERIDIISRSYDENLFIAQYRKQAADLLLPLVKQSQIMSRKYDVVVTNPPYMPPNGCPKLDEYVKKNFPDSKTDMFAVFIEKCGSMLKANGLRAMITMHSWMFLSSYEKLRAKMLVKDTVNMAHLGARAFEEIGGEVVQTTAWVTRNAHVENYKGTYCRLIEPNTQQGKEDMFLGGENRYYTTQSNFVKIPGEIFAYWISTSVISLLERRKLKEYGNAKQGLATTDNNKYLRLWYEINFNYIFFNANANNTDDRFAAKWFPYNKAGFFRKWSSINEYVVNYQFDGVEIKNDVMRKYPYLSGPGFVVKNTDSYFKQGISWNDVKSTSFCCRLVPNGFIFDAAAPTFFSNNDYLFLAYFNSSVFQVFSKIICQGLHYSTGHIPEIPFVEENDNKKTGLIEQISKTNVDLSVDDYDSYETSWGFGKHPLV